MLLVYFLFSMLYLKCKSENYFYNEEQLRKQNLLICITDILKKYFTEEKVITYVDMKSDDDDLLKALHSSSVTALVFRQTTTQSTFRHQGYLITARSVTEFTEYFDDLSEEPTWNPSARFLIVIKSLKEDELKKIFNMLVELHVTNVLVVNGTNDAHLYTYNPFDNYACGKYYSKVISYGLCTQTTHNLYPNKLVTGLRNCTLRASISHRPPYSLYPSNLAAEDHMTMGTEQYLFKLLAETEQFKVNFRFDFNDTLYTKLTPKMKAIGSMAKLQNNETDVMFGAGVIVLNRAVAFTYLYGHLDYDDSLRFIVKRASFKPIWKITYSVFKPFVWCLSLIAFVVYSTIMIILLRAEDKTGVILKMLESLLSHGCNMAHRKPIRRFFITWVWFAYLINSIYQSSLVSLTRHPLNEHQVDSEADLVKYNLKYCIRPAMLVNIYFEGNLSPPTDNDCMDPVLNIKEVAQSKDLFTLVQLSVFKYNKKMYYDEFGRSLVYYFSRPYTNVIYGIYFYKGFPLSDRMRTNAIRLREIGLVDKNLNDHYYLKKIKFHFHQKEFKTKFIMPWRIYVLGCTLSTIVFIFELLSKHYKKCFC